MIHEAVIVDVDGTLAEFNPNEVHQWVLGVEKDWDPFFEHMRNAPAITNVLKLVKLLKAQGQQIVICSGRPDSHREATVEWLKHHDVPFDAVYLRPNDTDHVADEVVKDQLLKAMHKDGYQPWLVLDDRTAVVDHWRAMGLTCLQCAPGDF